MGGEDASGEERGSERRDEVGVAGVVERAVVGGGWVGLGNQAVRSRA